MFYNENKDLKSSIFVLWERFMEINFNKKELETLLIDFYTIFNVTISLFDLNKQIIIAYPPQGEMNDFCKEILSNSTLDKKCKYCDNFGIDKCYRTEKTFIYRCHMQLLEIISPIFCNNVPICYIMLGQIRDIEDSRQVIPLIKETSELYNLDYDLLLNTFQKTSYFDPQKINSIIRLIEISINHIVLNNIISVRRNSLASSIETYINMNLEKNLSSETLCKRFNISRSLLYATSKEFFGKGISDYITTCRIEMAKKLLTENKYSVYEIAEKVGYKDTNYFIRNFKQHTKQTPKQYCNLKKYM